LARQPTIIRKLLVIFNMISWSYLKSKMIFILTCSICSEIIQKPYIPMKEWNIEGTLCGKCYSKKISEYYPGQHIRVNEEEE